MSDKIIHLKNDTLYGPFSPGDGEPLCQYEAPAACVMLQHVAETTCPACLEKLQSFIPNLPPVPERSTNA